MNMVFLIGSLFFVFLLCLIAFLPKFFPQFNQLEKNGEVISFQNWQERVLYHLPFLEKTLTLQNLQDMYDWLWKNERILFFLLAEVISWAGFTLGNHLALRGMIPRWAVWVMVVCPWWAIQPITARLKTWREKVHWAFPILWILIQMGMSSSLAVQVTLLILQTPLAQAIIMGLTGVVFFLITRHLNTKFNLFIILLRIVFAVLGTILFFNWIVTLNWMVILAKMSPILTTLTWFVLYISIFFSWQDNPLANCLDEKGFPRVFSQKGIGIYKIPINIWYHNLWFPLLQTFFNIEPGIRPFAYFINPFKPHYLTIMLGIDPEKGFKKASAYIDWMILDGTIPGGIGFFAQTKSKSQTPPTNPVQGWIGYIFNVAEFPIRAAPYDEYELCLFLKWKTSFLKNRNQETGEIVRMSGERALCFMLFLFIDTANTISKGRNNMMSAEAYYAWNNETGGGGTS